MGLFHDQPRSSFAWARVGDKLYVLGGHTGPFHDYPAAVFARELLEYDFVQESWRSLAAYPFGIQGLRMVHDGDSLYAFGGFRYSAAFDYSPNWRENEVHWSAVSDDEVYRYELKSDTWQHVTTMPRRRSSNVLLKRARKVYLIAGWDGTLRSRGNRSNPVFHTMVDVFDLDTLDFTPYDTEMPLPLRRALAGAEASGKLVLFAGLGSNPTGTPPLLDVSSVFDPAKNTFSDTEVPKLPVTLFSAGACFTGAKYVVAGGQTDLRGGLSDTVYTHTPGDADWKVAGKLSQPAMFVEMMPVSPSRVLAFGGHGDPDPLGLWEEISV
jgi:N-acetylneuraminic acid mutarotase